MEKDEEHKGSRTRCTSTSIAMRLRQESHLGRVVFRPSPCKGLAAQVIRVAESLALRSAGEQSHKCWHYLRMIPIFFHEHCLGLAGSSVPVPGWDWTGQGAEGLSTLRIRVIWISSR